MTVQPFYGKKATPVVTSVSYVTQSRMTVVRLSEREVGGYFGFAEAFDCGVWRFVELPGATGGSIVTKRWRDTYASVGTAAS
jgi:hypothetical protein